MTWQVRTRNLVSQHIEVALVYKDMLGVEEALAYLWRASVPRETAERVLFTDQRRGAPKAPAPKDAHPPFQNCRRRNRVQHAIVEAALKIQAKLGTEHALFVLQAEMVPEAVVTRVLAHGPRQLRARTPV